MTVACTHRSITHLKALTLLDLGSNKSLSALPTHLWEALSSLKQFSANGCSQLHHLPDGIDVLASRLEVSTPLLLAFNNLSNPGKISASAKLWRLGGEKPLP